jgi:ribonuclease HI
VVGSLKNNTDGAFLQGSYTGATGAVMRDCNGLFQAASARWLDSMRWALLAEAEALREGVSLIPEGTRENVILETDSQELVSLWNNKGKHRSEVTAILGDIEEMTKTLPSVRVVHTRRTANYAAHLCAQHALACTQSFLWSDPPSFLLQCLQFDYNNSIFFRKRAWHVLH